MYFVQNPPEEPQGGPGAPWGRWALGLGLLTAAGLLAALLASCGMTSTSDPVVEIEKAGKAAPRDSDLSVTLPDMELDLGPVDHDDDPATGPVVMPTTVRVTGGSVTHDVRQPRADPTVAVTGNSTTSTTGGPLGWLWGPWGLALASVLLVVTVALWPRLRGLAQALRGR